MDKTCLGELVPKGYLIKHELRPKRRWGGIALIYKASITSSMVSSTHDYEFSQFEHIDCQFNINMHKAPTTKENCLNTNVFLDKEWPIFLERHATLDKETIIERDINLI